MTDTQTRASLRERALAAHRAALEEEEARRAAETDAHRRRMIEQFVNEVVRVFGHGIDVGEIAVSFDPHDGRMRGIAAVDLVPMQARATTHGFVALFPCDRCGALAVYSDHFTTLAGYGAALAAHEEADARDRWCWSCQRDAPPAATPTAPTSEEVPF